MAFKQLERAWVMTLNGGKRRNGLNEREQKRKMKKSQGSKRNRAPNKEVMFFKWGERGGTNDKG